MNCREGCKTKDHASYAECLRSANPTVAALNTTSPLNDAFNQTKRDLAAYRSARVNGIQPEGTSEAKVRAAEQASKKLGRAYDANTDPPAHMISSTQAAKFTNRMTNANSE